MEITEDDMSLIGKPVMSLWGSTVRYGTIKTEEAKNQWKFCTINWINDEIYTESVKELAILRNDEKDHTKHIYRADELLFIDVDKQLKDLRDIKKKFKNEFKEMA